MATPDNELPVWPFMPNWRDGVLERLSWASVVMSSETGAEQRYSVRMSPRREIEAVFNPVGDTRTFFDLFLSELGGQEMMIPLWHDRHRIETAVEVGDSRIDCNTAYGELVDGGMAMLIGRDAWSHEVVEIDTVDGSGFTLNAVSDFAWPVGGLVLPLRRSRIDMQPAINNLTDSVGESSMRFILNQANDLPDNGSWGGLVYDTYPVVTQPSNWSDGVSLDFSRIMETEDNGTGLAFVRDIAERAFRTKRHVWHMKGRQENWEFRQFLYRMSGRRTPVWMPTGATDAVVAVQASAGATSVQVRKVGMTYIGGPAPGRDRVIAKTAEGYQVRQITGLGAPSLPAYERFNMNAALTYALPAGTPLSFVEIMRAEGDDIELLHHGDSEGATECAINFRSFNNARTAPTPIHVPSPEGLMSNFSCSSPAEDEDLCTVYNPWTLRWIMEFIDPLHVDGALNLYSYPIPQEVTSGMMPNGKTIALGDPIHMAALTQTRLIPGTNVSIQCIADFNYPNGDLGQPVVGYRTVINGSYVERLEYYFFFPVSSMHHVIDTQIQFAGYPVGGDQAASLSYDFGGGPVGSQAIAQGRLFPRHYEFDT